MESNKKLFNAKEIRACSPGQQVAGKFLVLDKVYRKTKDGKDMYNLKLADASGEIDSVVWDNCNVTGQLETGAVIGVLGDLGSFSGKMQITAKRIKVLEEEPSDYIKQAENIVAIKAHFAELVDSIGDPYLKPLIEQIFNPTTRDTFFRAPAAKRVHHNYPGGLLEHTCWVADLCLKIAASYPAVNRDLLLTGALLHDIGKIVEYKTGVSPQYTMEGKLLGLIVIVCDMLSQQIAILRINGLDFPERLEWMVKHMILSHHGSLEFGSPVIPLFPEAFLLHVTDNMDAKMYIFNTKIQDNDGDEEFFTNYDSFFAQQFFTYKYNPED